MVGEAAAGRHIVAPATVVLARVEVVAATTHADKVKLGLGVLRVDGVFTLVVPLRVRDVLEAPKPGARDE